MFRANETQQITLYDSFLNLPEHAQRLVERSWAKDIADCVNIPAVWPHQPAGIFRGFSWIMQSLREPLALSLTVYKKAGHTRRVSQTVGTDMTERMIYSRTKQKHLPESSQRMVDCRRSGLSVSRW